MFLNAWRRCCCCCVLAVCVTVVLMKPHFERASANVSRSLLSLDLFCSTRYTILLISLDNITFGFFFFFFYIAFFVILTNPFFKAQLDSLLCK